MSKFKTKLPPVRFTLTLGEGPINYCGVPQSAKNWSGANNILKQLAAHLNQDGGYYKLDFEIEWLDGDTYNGTYELKTDGPFDLRQHILSHLKYWGLIERPNHISEEEWPKHIALIENTGQDMINQCREVLDAYMIDYSEVTYLVPIPFQGYVKCEVCDGLAITYKENEFEFAKNLESDSLQWVSGEELDALFEKYNKKYTTKPAKIISLERYWEMLEVLPPENWCNGVFDHFRMSEYQTGTITTQFAKYHDKCIEKYIDTKDKSTWITLEDFDKAEEVKDEIHS